MNYHKHLRDSYLVENAGYSFTIAAIGAIYYGITQKDHPVLAGGIGALLGAPGLVTTARIVRNSIVAIHKLEDLLKR